MKISWKLTGFKMLKDYNQQSRTWQNKSTKLNPFFSAVSNYKFDKINLSKNIKNSSPLSTINHWQRSKVYNKLLIKPLPTYIPFMLSNDLNRRSYCISMKENQINSINTGITTQYKSEEQFKLYSDVESYLRNTINQVYCIKNSEINKVKNTSETKQQIESMHLVLDELVSNINAFLLDLNNSDLYKHQCFKYLQYILSHLESIDHHYKLLLGKSVFVESYNTIFTTLIQDGYSLLNGKNIKENQVILPRTKATTLSTPDNYQLEAKRFEEQKQYTLNPEFKRILAEIWQYTVKNGYRTKKIFISYAWPNEGDDHHEWWSQKFVMQLAVHLTWMGLQVFLDKNHSGPGFLLGNFMKKIQQVDHVLVISTRTMGEKLKYPESGVNFEYMQIKESLQKYPNLINQRFVMPVLLNHNKYCHPDFSDIAEISICKEGYLNAIESLAMYLYGIGELEFRVWWREILQKNKMTYLWRLPLKNPNLIERKQLLTEIDSRFADRDNYQSTNPCMLVICQGITGIGKTQLAISYCYAQYGKKYQKIFWFTAETALQIKAAYLDLAKALNFKDEKNENILIERIKQWFETVPECLVVFDNVSDYEVLRPYLPRLGVDILVTTYTTDWQRYGACIPVESFSTEEALEFISKCLARKNLDVHDDIHSLAKSFSNYPLALAQVVAYIKKNKLNISHFFYLYSTYKDQILANRNLPIDYKGEPLLYAWDAILTQIEKESVQAGELIKAISIYYYCLIPESIFRIFCEKLKATTSESYLEARRVLIKYGLIKFDQKTHLIILYPIVNEVIHLKLTQEQKYQLCIISVLTLAEAKQQLPQMVEPERSVVSNFLRLIQENFDLIEKEAQKPQKLPVLKIFNLPIGNLANSAEAQSEKLLNKNALYMNCNNFNKTSLWHVPAQNPHFTGREVLLEELLHHLGNSSLETLKPVVIAACHGLGGVGKSQLAIEFIYRYNEHYKMIFWINAESDEQIQLAFTELIQNLNLTTQTSTFVENIQILKHWLINHPGNLFVFDNAKNYQAIEKFIPPTGNYILVTSRNINWPEKCIEVDVFAIEEAREYITKILGKEAIERNELIDKLCFTLGRLPLALAQATAYIQQNKISVHDYLILYEQKKAYLLTKNSLLPAEYPASVYLTWKITMEAVQQESELASRILTFCAFCFHQAIPAFIFEKFVNLLRSIRKISIYGLFEESLGVLASYSLINIDEKYYQISMHQLVQDIVRDSVIKDIREILLDILLTFNLIYPYSKNKRDDLLLKKLFYPHMKELLRYFDKYGVSLEFENKKIQGKTDGLRGTLILELLHDASMDLGDSRTENIIAQRIFELQRKINKDESYKSAIIALNDLGISYSRSGDLHKGKKKLEQALELQRKYQGDFHIETARTIMNLGSTCLALGEALKGRILLEEALKIHRALPDKNLEEIAKTLMSLGTSYKLTSNIVDSIKYYEEALQMQRQYYGEIHPEIARTCANLGNAYHMQGEVKKAQEMYEASLDISRIFVDKNNIDMLRIQLELSNLYLKQNELQKAIKLCQNSLESLKLDYPHNFEDIIHGLKIIGLIHFKLGKEKNCISIYEELYQTVHVRFGENSVEVANTLMDLGETYFKLNIQAKSIACYEKALPILRSKRNTKSLLKALSLLAHKYIKENEIQKSSELLEELLAIQENTGVIQIDKEAILMILARNYHYLGLIDKSINFCEEMLTFINLNGKMPSKFAIELTRLADAYFAIDKLHTSVKLYKTALELDKTYYEESWEKHVQVLCYCADAHYKLGDKHKSKDLYIKALEVGKLHYGASSEKIIPLLSDLADICYELNELNRTVELCIAKISIYKLHYSDNSKLFIKPLNNLAVIYLKLGDIHKSISMGKQVLCIQKIHSDIAYKEILSTLVFLADTYHKLGDISNYINYCEEILAIYNANEGEDNADKIRFVCALGTSYISIGNIYRSKVLFESALAAIENCDKPPEEAAKILANLGSIYLRINKRDRGIDTIRQAIKIAELHYHRNLIILAAFLMQIQQVNAQYNIPEILGYMKRAYDIILSHSNYGSGHPVVKEIEDTLQKSSPISSSENKQELIYCIGYNQLGFFRNKTVFSKFAILLKDAQIIIGIETNKQFVDIAFLKNIQAEQFIKALQGHIQDKLDMGRNYTITTQFDVMKNELYVVSLDDEDYNEVMNDNDAYAKLVSAYYETAYRNKL